MADYRIGIAMYQNHEGDEDAKVKITINGNVVAAEHAVTGKDSDGNATIASYEVSGLDAPAPDGSSRVVMKIELLNYLYVDDDNIRSVSVTFLGYNPKASDGKYYQNNAGLGDPQGKTLGEVSDWTTLHAYAEAHMSGVTGDDTSTLSVPANQNQWDDTNDVATTPDWESKQYYLWEDQITITMPLVWEMGDGDMS